LQILTHWALFDAEFIKFTNLDLLLFEFKIQAISKFKFIDFTLSLSFINSSVSLIPLEFLSCQRSKFVNSLSFSSIMPSLLLSSSFKLSKPFFEFGLVYA